MANVSLTSISNEYFAFKDTIEMKKFFSIIGRIFRAAWNAVTLSRRAVGNLLFIALVLILVVAVFFDRETRVPEGAALVLSPVGNIVEQASAC